MISRRAAIWSVVIALTSMAMAAASLFVGHLVTERNRSKYRLIKLLSETDYRTLLSGCRELSEGTASGKFRVGRYEVGSNPHPGLQQFPSVILDVEPLCVVLSEDTSVVLEMGAFPSYGMVAYPEGSSARDFFVQGDVELVPGLWFYDEDYCSRFPEYVQFINELIDKGKQRFGINEDREGTEVHLKY